MMRDRDKTVASPSRRRSLQAMLTMMAGTGINLAAGLADNTASQRTRSIPSSGEEIPVMGLGTYRTLDVSPDPSSLEPLREVMRLFIEHGGRMVDSSPMYGRAEDVVGRLVSGLDIGDRVFFATKVWTSGREAGMRQMNESFELMQTPFIDLMQVHNLSDTATQVRNIRTLQDEGRVRYVGVTHYTTGAFDDLEGWMKRENLDYVQFPYSIVNRTAEERLIPAARDLGVAIIAHRNFQQGRLFSRVKGRQLPGWAADFDCPTWGNFFLKYLMAEPGMTNLIPATSDPEHIVDNMNAGLGALPDQATRRRMVQFIESL
ncbi:MAG: aldo/keto reductase [Gammaproteobacteria bacterium]|nr:aldo/keto reductase [Gammaproteobacteria bacterium]